MMKIIKKIIATLNFNILDPTAEPKTLAASFAPMIIAIVAINKISNIINFLTRKLSTCQLHPQTDSQLHPLSQQNILDELLSLSHDQDLKK